MIILVKLEINLEMYVTSYKTCYKCIINNQLFLIVS